MSSATNYRVDRLERGRHRTFGELSPSVEIEARRDSDLLVFEVPEADARHLRIGSTITITIDLDPRD